MKKKDENTKELTTQINFFPFLGFMLEILFICHGNICRSPAAEMVMKHLVQGSDGMYVIDSAATTNEEIGNEIYPPMRRTLMNHGIQLVPHRARKTTRKDYAFYDYIVGMDEENMEDLRYIYGLGRLECGSIRSMVYA